MSSKSTRIKILDVEPDTECHDGRRVHHAARLAPAAISIEGYVDDVNGEGYSRDIGRSFSLGGHHYYLFGDTFCKHHGQYVGLVSNTAALVPDPENHPRCSCYTDVNADTGLVAPFLRLTAEEEALSKPPADGGQPTARVTLWGFGGVVEVAPGVGLHWYQKGIIRDHHDGQQRNEYQGVGLATIQTDPATGHLSSHRHPGLLFGPDEPKIGSLSGLLLHADDDHNNNNNKTLYLWGEHANHAVLARVPLTCAHLRDHYTFWTGTSWDPDWRAAAIVLPDLPQGQVFRSPLFGPQWPWAFVGTGRWADSTIWVGRARRPEGPWELAAAGVAGAIDQPDGFRYCIYPLPHTVCADRGQLRVVWSECWPGGVVVARVTFPTFAYQVLEEEEEESGGGGMEDGG